MVRAQLLRPYNGGVLVVSKVAIEIRIVLQGFRRTDLIFGFVF